MSRTRAQRAAAKRLLSKPAGPLMPIDIKCRWHPEWMTRAYQNNRYVVTIDDNATIKGVAAIKAMVLRHD